MTIGEMTKLLHLLLELEKQNAIFHNLSLPAPQLRSPATEHDLTAFRNFLSSRSLVAPSSLLTLLCISNGISNFLVLERISLRSTWEIMEGHEADVVEWEDEFGPLSQLVIGAGETGAFLALDHTRPDQTGDFPAVVVDTGGRRDEYQSLPDFLWARLEYQQSVARGQLADRASLPDN